MQVTCIQLDITLGNVEENKKKAAIYIEKAAKSGAKVVVLPELWTTGYCLETIGHLIEDQEEIIKLLKNLAKQNEVTIVGGSIPTKNVDKLYNTLIVISKEGKLIKEYSKVHLFRLMNEHLYLNSGTSDGMFEIGNNQAAGMICYDLRFPEWFRMHAINGAEIIFVVAEWPTPRINQWKVMLQSRAIENQCYIVGCNRVGTDESNEFGGHSLIIDPYGTVLAEGGEREELITAQINLSLVTEARQYIPILSDRQPEMYEKLQSKSVK